VFSHPEALVSDVDDHRTVHEPVEDRSRDRGIVEQLPQLARARLVVTIVD
jgi:hypothetical protein